MCREVARGREREWSATVRCAKVELPAFLRQCRRDRLAAVWWRSVTVVPGNFVAFRAFAGARGAEQQNNRIVGHWPNFGPLRFDGGGF